MKFILFLAVALAGLARPAAAALLEIDHRHSNIEVDVRATIDPFVGHLEKYQAAIDCNPATNLPAAAEVSFDFADLKTGDTNRDAAMLKWLEYDSNPRASFRLNGWRQNGATHLALGELTIHGVKQAVQMPVAVKNTGGTWDISGESDFDYRDFSLPKIRKVLVLTVAPHLKVTFHLAGKLAAAK